ncbi:helix-turn-helix domain-containing protein [Saccharicrinis aurantiacus]|uniref:helix-turn-helix domain-containing protein n=1 Tax=Saccharicrinis aurantiacus TaxID=1849719 RepID=UPI00095024B5|nr:helix-turn-helix domain-containing protein [Saccharicrinis aurantiacus]
MDTELERIQQTELQANNLNFGLLNQKVDYLINQLTDLGKEIERTKKEPKENTGDIIQVKDAAKLLGRSVSTVYIKASKGELPSWNDSGRLLFSRNELENWVLANRKESTKLTNERSSLSNMKKSRKRYSKK